MRLISWLAENLLASWEGLCSVELVTILIHILGRGHIILKSRELMWCYTCRWDVRGDLTFNSADQIHTSVTLLTSRDLAWSSGRLTCQRASQISAVAHISWDVTYVSSAHQTLQVDFQKRRICLLKKCANGTFYISSHQIIEISIWEPTHGKGKGRSWK